MKRFFFLAVIISVMLMLIIGCGGSKKAASTVQPASDEMIKSIPKWFSGSLPNDPDYYYGRGTATSRDMQLAINKAQQQALLQISKSIEVRFKALEKSFKEETGIADDSQYLESFTQASKSVVDQVLTGAQEDRSELRNENGVFRAYVMYRVPVGTASSALMNKLKQQEALYTQFRASQAFKELEEETKKAVGGE